MFFQFVSVLIGVSAGGSAFFVARVGGSIVLPDAMRDRRPGGQTYPTEWEYYGVQGQGRLEV